MKTIKDFTDADIGKFVVGEGDICISRIIRISNTGKLGYALIRSIDDVDPEEMKSPTIVSDIFSGLSATLRGKK